MIVKISSVWKVPTRYRYILKILRFKNRLRNYSTYIYRKVCRNPVRQASRSVCPHRRHVRLENLRTLILADNLLREIALYTTQVPVPYLKNKENFLENTVYRYASFSKLLTLLIFATKKKKTIFLIFL
jgi:hypothetical protein